MKWKIREYAFGEGIIYDVDGQEVFATRIGGENYYLKSRTGREYNFSTRQQVEDQIDEDGELENLMDGLLGSGVSEMKITIEPSTNDVTVSIVTVTKPVDHIKLNFLASDKFPPDDPEAA